jgi:hypothetical protein
MYCIPLFRYVYTHIKTYLYKHGIDFVDTLYTLVVASVYPLSFSHRSGRRQFTNAKQSGRRQLSSLKLKGSVLLELPKG